MSMYILRYKRVYILSYIQPLNHTVIQIATREMGKRASPTTCGYTVLPTVSDGIL